MNPIWEQCVQRLELRLPEDELSKWVKPLQAVEKNNGLRLLAPNAIVLQWVQDNLLDEIRTIINLIDPHHGSIRLEVGSNKETVAPSFFQAKDKERVSSDKKAAYGRIGDAGFSYNRLNPYFTFDNFIEGASNQLAKAAAVQVARALDGSFNPLFIYGDVGLGKSHLMHSIGNRVLKNDDTIKVCAMNSEDFVSHMINALQHNGLVAFKHFYRNLQVLLIDDIQFLAGKDRSQEEFFHTFNTLLERRQQVVLTCDRYPKDVDGLEERLQSRFGSGLTVAIEPPDFETRIAILLSKAEKLGVSVPKDVLSFIAKHIHSNVRELEGALRRIAATAQLTGQELTLELAQRTLQDVISIADRQISIDNIQKTVAQYYNIRVAGILSSQRQRSLARPRQVAMALSRELTGMSLPAIGSHFGGRNHATVLHACRKIEELRQSDSHLEEDYRNLMRTLQR